MSPSNLSNETDDSRPLGHVIDSLVQLGEERSSVSVADIQERVGERSFGPFLFIPAIFELSPIGGIPGVPTLLGLVVIITAGQIILGRRHFWLPQFIANRSVQGDRIAPAMQKIRPVIRFVDKVLRPRLRKVTKKPLNRVVAVVCVVCALTVPPLELVPFASSAPFTAIALIGLGLTACDGVFVWLGIGVAAATILLLNVII